MTIYRQTANPNATNSELDAKKIIIHKQLTSDQKDELIDDELVNNILETDSQ